jgi:prephenate dehydrogenase
LDVKIKTVGILGFGRFGSMVYRYLKDRVNVVVFDSDPSKLEGLKEGVAFEEIAKADLLVLAVPISAIPRACRKLAPYLTKRQVVLDTCSVKEKPVKWMLENLPSDVQILGTHPLFGPDSGKDGIAGFKIALCPVTIRKANYKAICNFLRSLELVLIETSPEEHDRQIAVSQAIFHLIAEAMRRLEWGAKPISTPGPDSFYPLVKTVQRDTNQLFHDMERENPYAAECRKQFIRELLRLDQELKSKG